MVRISYRISLQIKNVFHHPPKIKDELWFLKIQIIFQVEFLSLLVFKTNEKKSSSLSIKFIFEISVWGYLKRLGMSPFVWYSFLFDGQIEMDAIWSVGNRSRMVKLNRKYRFSELICYGWEVCLWLAILENDE